MKNDIPLYLNYVTGIRSWKLKEQNNKKWYLESPSYDHIWNPLVPAVAENKCDLVEVGDVVLASSMGIYAYKSDSKLDFSCDIYKNLIGTVALWGKVIEHQDGYRGEYAYPVSIDYISCSKCNTISNFLDHFVFQAEEIWCNNCFLMDRFKVFLTAHYIAKSKITTQFSEEDVPIKLYAYFNEFLDKGIPNLLDFKGIIQQVIEDYGIKTTLNFDTLPTIEDK